MNDPINVLIVEDSEDDALLIVNEIREGGYDPNFKRVETREAFLATLKKGDWDIIISDYSLPKFSGLDAVKLLKKSGIDLPFILVSGTIGEEIAVKSLLAGAHDFIVKGKWERLVPAIKRELKEAKVRQERIYAEKQLIKEKKIAQQYLDIAGVLIFVLNRDQEVTLINKKGCEILGYKEDEIIGKNWFDNFLPVDIKEEIKSVFNKLMSGEIEPVEYYENVVLTKDGNVRDIAWHNSVVRNDKGEITHVLSSGEDITERKKADEILMEKENQLRQSQKMEAIGTLAGGIAHDFNNMLTGIIGYTEITMDSLNPEDDLYHNLQKALKSSYSARDIVAQLLTFSRKTKEEKEILQLNELTSETLKLIGSSLPSNVSVEKLIDKNIHLIMASEIQIQQILMNLCINAGHAMPEGGNLKITLKNHVFDKFKVLPDQEISGLYVVLSVEDSGIGMDKTTMERIFEPFFTTKEVGKGTGLGLSTVFGIVKQHDGYITVDSKKGIGTIFHVYLPAVKKDDKTIMETVTQEKPTAKKDESVIFEDKEKEQNRFEVETIQEEFVINIIGNKSLSKSEKQQILDYYVLARNERKKIIVNCASDIEKHLITIGFNKFLEVKPKPE